MIGDIVFAALSIAAFVVCWIFVIREPMRDPFSAACQFVPGAAGFSFFPIINIAVAGAIVTCWVQRWSKP